MQLDGQAAVKGEETAVAFARISLLSQKLHGLATRYEADLYIQCWEAQNEGKDVKSQIEKAWLYEDRETGPPTSLELFRPGVVIGAIEGQRRKEDEQNAKGAYRTQQTVYSRVMHCSYEKLENLKPILLKDMSSGHRHTGQYILLRIASRVDVNVNLNMAASDMDGNALHLRLHNYPTLPHRLPTGIEADAVFPIGTVLAIKEPSTKRAFDSFDEIICVDTPTDVVRLTSDHPLLRNVTWQSISGLKSWPSPSKSALSWKKDGNAHYRASRYIQAESAYSGGLQQNPSEHERSALLLARAICRIKLEKYNSALDDATSALELLNSGTAPAALLEKALSLKAAAAYKLRRWQDAKDAYMALSKHCPGSKEAAKGLLACDARLGEASTGDYDLAAILRISQEDCRIRLDVANYIGSVAVAADINAGGSRGLIVTRDVEAGEILLATKAIAYSTPSDNIDTARALDMRILSHHEKTQINFRLSLISKLFDQPELLSMVKGLSSEADYAGDGMSYNLSGNLLALQDTTIDIARLYSIVVSNNFAPQNLGLLDLSRPDTTNDIHPSALFLQNSLINHSCLYNCNWTNFNDLQIIRALRPIPAGSPLSISYSVDEVFTLRTADFRGFGFACGCVLCLADQREGEQCGIREHIRKEVVESMFKDRRPGAYSTRVLKSAIGANKKKLQQIEKTYHPERTEIRLEAAQQHRYLAQLYGYLARTTNQSSHYTPAVEHHKDSLRALGVQLAEDSDVQGALPVLTTPQHEQEASLVSMLQIAQNTLCLGEEETARSWVNGAAWTHDVLYGGEKELFIMRAETWLREFGLMDLV